MTFTEEQVDWIVAEVVRRLKALSGVAVGERSSPAAELTINERVITLRSIEGKLLGVNRLQIQPRAIVTPAVKDELRQRQIVLVRQA